MKQILIASGKGGTGKTTVTASLAWLAAQEQSIITVDADVDAANLFLVLQPEILASGAFIGGEEAVIDPDTCIACGACMEACKFHAIIPDKEVYAVDAASCEGCRVCRAVCPAEAVTMIPAVSGDWYESKTIIGDFIHAKLRIAAENSGKLVALLREKARNKAESEDIPLILIDGPPGIGCPVMSSMTGVDVVLLVVEPTVSGRHDLDRILALTKHFKIDALVVINKYDINSVMADDIEVMCSNQGVPVIGRIPFDTAVVDAVVSGGIVARDSDGPASSAMKAIWHELKTR